MWVNFLENFLFQNVNKRFSTIVKFRKTKKKSKKSMLIIIAQKKITFK